MFPLKITLFSLLICSFTCQAWDPFSKETWDALAMGGKLVGDWTLDQAARGGDLIGEGIKYAKEGVSWFAAATGLDKAFDFFIGMAREVYNRAAAPIVEPLYENVIKPYYQNVIKPVYDNTLAPLIAGALDALTAGKISDAIKFLNEMADIVQGIPKLLTEKTDEFKQMPEQLAQASRDLEITINQIFTTQNQLQKQKAEVVAQDLKGKGIAELSQLHDSLLDALTSLEQSLALLAGCEQNKPCSVTDDKVKELNQALKIIGDCKKTNNCLTPDAKNPSAPCDCKPETLNAASTLLTQSTTSRCNFGVLCDFRKAIITALGQAQAGVSQVMNNIGTVNAVINNPSMGYPSLPARIRAMATMLKGGS